MVRAASSLPLPEGRRSTEVFVDGDLEIRLYAPKGHDPQTPHDRDELYIVASGTGKFRAGNRVESFAPGALLYVAAHETHRFEDFSNDFATWVVFYGPVKAPPARFACWLHRELHSCLTERSASSICIPVCSCWRIHAIRNITKFHSTPACLEVITCAKAWTSP